MAKKRVEFDDRLLSRIHGCLAGVAVGDALGMPMAGWTPTEVKRRYGKVIGLISQAPDHPLHGKLPLESITDDTQLTMWATPSSMLSFQYPGFLEETRTVSTAMAWRGTWEGRVTTS